MKNKITILATFLFLISNQSYASKISLGSVIVDFRDPKTKFIDVPVYNSNDDGKKAFVKATVYEVLNPGTEKEQKVEVEKNKKNSLIVSPQKMIIPYDGQKNIRFVSLYNNLKEDKIFRVKVEPIVGNFETKAKQAVKLLIAYETLVMIRPENPEPKVEGTRVGNVLTFKNTGNTNILSRGGIQCPKGESDKEKCSEIPGFRLYSGNSKVITLPHDTQAEFTFDLLGKNETRSY